MGTGLTRSHLIGTGLTRSYLACIFILITITIRLFSTMINLPIRPAMISVTELGPIFTIIPWLVMILSRTRRRLTRPRLILTLFALILIVGF